ncbi:hypothetical protein FA15DRAFT_665828 [Coprinopsis marcescibilis]|uniref:ABM domain-containing protein n=1 Tax=Coprinopsis marcescibilis TaxID=230819 RepID=A0A5C3L5Z9_COPMA|nr:hypothetical protein FA15DRAFT_665828 [Coprinopsis marcescibilis]
MALNILAPEIIWFTPSDEYLDDPASTLSAVHEHSVHKGMIGSYYGIDLCNPEINVWIMAWKSLTHHQCFMQEESYIDFILPVMDAMVGTGKITQVSFNNLLDFQRALSSPLTQFIYVTVRPLHDREYELEPLVKMIRNELRSIPGCLASSWGSSVEDDHLELGVVGWRSLADRDNAVQGRTRLASLIHRVNELSNVELRYAKLRRYRDDAIDITVAS